MDGQCIKIPMAGRKRTFLSFFGLGFGSISTWQSKTTKIHGKVIVVIYTIQDNDRIEAKF